MGIAVTKTKTGAGCRKYTIIKMDITVSEMIMLMSRCFDTESKIRS